MEREVESPSTMPMPMPPTYKVYKRRFWGLAQLVLLNIVVSWDVRALRSLLHGQVHYTNFVSG